MQLNTFPWSRTMFNLKPTTCSQDELLHQTIDPISASLACLHVLQLYITCCGALIFTTEHVF